MNPFAQSHSPVFIINSPGIRVISVNVSLFVSVGLSVLVSIWLMTR